jgi:Ca2+-binding EF-hand superfamily protein
MKANMVRVMAAACIGLATTAVTVTQAGDRTPVVNGTNSINAPVVNIAETFRELDRNGDGWLSVTEFSRVDRQIGRLQASEPGLPDQFGYVTVLGPFWSDQDLAYLFMMLDTNRDGLLSPAEFGAINQVAAAYNYGPR